MNIEVTVKKFPEIETSRLILKEIIETDDKDIFEIFSDDEAMKYYDIEPLKDLEEAKQLIQQLNRRFKNKKGIRWGIHLKDNYKLIGSCGYHSHNKQSFRAEIGYELSKEYWGQGLMQEALQSIIDFGINNLALNRIQALVEPKNIKSINLLQKIGFNEEGTLYEYEFYKGEFKDLAMLSLLKVDYHKTFKKVCEISIR
ncbi:GNAT family N-acetyltransferase [Clostridium sp. CS001]|uniref:GNAT family N-acetyltransferase n=1 Tax=Clostridium sp. CS001 TaxID=2880648 RepID=UPI001CF40D47|nr:GNAT family N-acetyltransferase [Clostridium sp. CS001]MCB2291540.1 GNAT family N-acetyltransferase [Clostridium sp. CS001]